MAACAVARVRFASAAVRVWMPSVNHHTEHDGRGRQAQEGHAAEPRADGRRPGLFRQKARRVFWSSRLPWSWVSLVLMAGVSSVVMAGLPSLRMCELVIALRWM